MGFSPGEFCTEDGNELHLDLKDGGRIVLWGPGEMTRIFVIDKVNAQKFRNHLNLLIEMAIDHELGR